MDVPSPRRPNAFTLVELLVVIAIIGVLMALVLPAMNAIKGAGNVTTAAYDVAGALENARSYAMANNTYTWVGFFEEDPTKAAGTAGTGRVVVSIVCAKDGTQIVDPNASKSATNQLDPLKLAQVGKLIKVDNVHLINFTDGSGDGDTFDKRPAPGKSPFPDKYARIGDTSPPTSAKFPLQYPVGGTTTAPTAQYTFTKMVQFNPRGESRVNITYEMRPIVEVGLQPTHGSAVDANNKNVVAIQFTGIGGNVKIYRR
jgi:prepilin-type N-terminal cleavage/methylation domain-containing protein